MSVHVERTLSHLMSSHTSLAQVLSLFTFIHGHHHGAPSLTRFSLSTSTCSSLSPFHSTSCTPSCTLSSTTRSSWKACATPPTRRVRTPTTSPPPSHFLSSSSKKSKLVNSWGSQWGEDLVLMGVTKDPSCCSRGHGMSHNFRWLMQWDGRCGTSCRLVRLQPSTVP